jgi:hypothetical protein
MTKTLPARANRIPQNASPRPAPVTNATSPKKIATTLNAAPANANAWISNMVPITQSIGMDASPSQNAIRPGQRTCLPPGMPRLSERKYCPSVGALVIGGSMRTCGVT